MNDSRKKAISTLLSASRRLAECAADGEWESVAELQHQQHELVVEFFSSHERKSLTAKMMSDLAHVRVYTDMVLELAKRKRKTIVGAADKVKIGRNTVSAYAECS